jgi:hypothetical protein
MSRINTEERQYTMNKKELRVESWELRRYGHCA